MRLMTNKENSKLIFETVSGRLRAEDDADLWETALTVLADEFLQRYDGEAKDQKWIFLVGACSHWVRPEFGPPEPEYEIELGLLEPAYNTGGEQYSTSNPNDWVVYASHESSITVCGRWLTDVFKQEWPECGQRAYGGPYSTDDLRGTWDTK